MEIECPHCKAVFEGSDCALKEQKQTYKWYEFTGFICFVLLLIIIAPIAYFGKKHWNKIMKITAVNVN